MSQSMGVAPLALQPLIRPPPRYMSISASGSMPASCTCSPLEHMPLTHREPLAHRPEPSSIWPLQSLSTPSQTSGLVDSASHMPSLPSLHRCTPAQVGPRLHALSPEQQPLSITPS